MKILLLVSATLIVASSATAAHDTFQALSLEGLDMDDRVTCVYGNQTTVTGYEGWWGGNETYARLISPQIEPCNCDIGFTIRSVNIMLGLDGTANLQVMARLLEADWNGSCWVPGATLAYSPMHVIDYIQLFAYYQITIPCDFPCAVKSEPYFITVDFVGGTSDRVNIVGGGDTDPCTSYNNWGAGWYDLIADIGFFNGLTMWAVSECCYEPIDTDASSWGAVKSLYR
ncbi:hypothetical protein H8E07_02645 [bacterium]|nr:hypothetical protein [bacterium]